METENSYSASEQALGYIYQARFALLKLLQLPESSSVLIEAADDLDLTDKNGLKILASLKHKAVGDHLTDLSTDFWKSVRIWLTRYNDDGRIQSSLRFFLFTTAGVSPKSFLRCFLPDGQRQSIVAQARNVLQRSKSKVIRSIAAEFDKLTQNELEDFYSRISIVESGPRVTDIPSAIVNQHMRTIRREFRLAVFERLEGWWNNVSIDLMAGIRKEPVFGYEVSDRLAAFADEYKSDNLPITLRGEEPEETIDPDSDSRVFVVQLRAIDVHPSRIQSAILDYYKAFQQRSLWARENVLLVGEIEEYEDRLVDEWNRYKDVVFEELNGNEAEEVLVRAGRALYKWAEFETTHIRIRDRVTEPFVVRGAFHILANSSPLPRIYWHPKFLERIGGLIEVAQ